MLKSILAALAAAVIAASLAIGASTATAAQISSYDDTARFLAGMTPNASSPLTALTHDADWQNHTKVFDQAWTQLDQNQLAKVRTWSAANIKDFQPVLYYMFSGPDFLYANAFFPNASTYVFSGLEPVGKVPELTEMKPGSLEQDLRELQTSLNSVFSFSFFITKKMRVELATGRMTGTLPVLYVFLARAGKTITAVDFVDLAEDGSVSTGVDVAKAKGVKISFTGTGGQAQTLYYFSTDISDTGVAKSGFLQFCASLGKGSSFIKSASYLMHIDAFSKVRSFLLDNSTQILQDDSGIPVKYFDAVSWQLIPYGNYLTPISLFPNTYQSKLKDVFQKAPKSPLDFSFGYRWRARESNLMQAVKGSPAVQDIQPPTDRPNSVPAAETPKPKASLDTKPRRTKNYRTAQRLQKTSKNEAFDWNPFKP